MIKYLRPFILNQNLFIIKNGSIIKLIKYVLKIAR